MQFINLWNLRHKILLLIAFTISILLGLLSCSDNQESADISSPATDEESFTFFDLTKTTRLTKGVRSELEEKLGRADKPQLLAAVDRGRGAAETRVAAGAHFDECQAPGVQRQQVDFPDPAAIVAPDDLHRPVAQPVRRQRFKPLSPSIHISTASCHCALSLTSG